LEVYFSTADAGNRASEVRILVGKAGEGIVGVGKGIVVVGKGIVVPGKGIVVLGEGIVMVGKGTVCLTHKITVCLKGRINRFLNLFDNCKSLDK